ncbi:hypothetical protein [uncultured Brevundimonas sp.]|uniref:hypothetical protein n=1 Tax=uncultured Brevundimonas sp. TaxID=213418 RepID=UPI0025D485AA|nr:hypothetical protein [uncultured Brevundimonas sp.]
MKTVIISPAAGHPALKLLGEKDMSRMLKSQRRGASAQVIVRGHRRTIVALPFEKTLMMAR